MTRNVEKSFVNWPFASLIPRKWPVGGQQVFWVLLACLTLTLGVAGLLMLGAWVVGIKLLLEESRNAIEMAGAERYFENRNAMLILAAVVGAPLVIWRAWLAGRQVRINQEGHYTELFTKAVEQLGADKVVWRGVKRNVPDGKGGTQEVVQSSQPNIEVRLGAIYALERVMHDSARDAGPILETLCEYVRENCGAAQTYEGGDMPEREIGEALEDWLDRLDVAVAEKKEWAYSLRENAPGNRADVKAALRVIARRPAEWQGPDAKPDLRRVNLQGADLQDVDCTHFNFASARMEGANLDRVPMAGADLAYSLMDGANLRRAQLENANLFLARLVGSDLSLAQLKETDLSMARLHGAWLKSANLTGAYLRQTKLHGVKMRAVTFDEEDIFGAGLQDIELTHIKFKGAYLKSDFRTVRDLPSNFAAMIQEAFGNKSLTILPEEMDPPDHWFVGYDFLKEREAWRAFKRSLGM